MGHLHQRPLGIAEQQQVGLGVRQHGTAHLVRPVVVVGDAAQAGLDGADHHRRAVKGLAAALGIDRHRPVGALVGLGVGGVGVVGADLAVGGVAIDHGIHIAGGHPEEQIGLAQALEIRRRVPVRLADDAHPEALSLQQPPHQGHAEAGMVDIGIAGHQDDVAGIPAQSLHFRPAHGQEGRRTEAVRPEFAVGEKRCGEWHGPTTRRCGAPFSHVRPLSARRAPWHNRPTFFWPAPMLLHPYSRLSWRTFPSDRP